MRGGTPFGRGHLYRILSNPIYAGLIEHRGETYPGQHDAIVNRETFDAVQAQLASNSHARLVKAYSRDPALLSGLLCDANGERFVTNHASRNGRRYRCYLSAAAKRRRGTADGQAPAGPIWRLPATEVECAVIDAIVSEIRDEVWLSDNVGGDEASIAERTNVATRARQLADQLEGNDVVLKRGVLLALVPKVTLREKSIAIDIDVSALRGQASDGRRTESHRDVADRDDIIVINQELHLKRRGSETRIITRGWLRARAGSGPREGTGTGTSVVERSRRGGLSDASGTCRCQFHERALRRFDHPAGVPVAGVEAINPLWRRAAGIDASPAPRGRRHVVALRVDSGDKRD